MVKVVGIDVGITGAIAAIDTVAGEYQIADMPLVVHKGKRGGKAKMPASMVAGRKLAKMLRNLDPKETTVFIERVGAMPGQGVVSMFNFGHSAGVVRGVCEALGFKIVFVRPQVWKKTHGLLGTEKDAARILAISKYPSLAGDLKRKRDGGRADAILIAQWGVGYDNPTGQLAQSGHH